MLVQDFHLHSLLASLTASAYVLADQDFEGNHPTRNPLANSSSEDSFALLELVCPKQPFSAHRCFHKQN